MLKSIGTVATKCMTVLLATYTVWGASVELVGTLRNANGESISGRITVIREGPNGVVFANHQIGDEGVFRISSDAKQGLVVFAAAPNHASQEKVIPTSAAGIVPLTFALPVGQDVHGRVVDTRGNGVSGAALRVRYHEPDKPKRRVAFNAEELTDGDGYFLLYDVGVDVPFVVDVYAEGFVAEYSQQFKIADGHDKPLEDIVLKQYGATVLVTVTDKSGEPVSGIEVAMQADPSGLPDEAKGSWMHHKSYHKIGVTSDQGNVRFSGTPAGVIIVWAKGQLGIVDKRDVAVEGQELRIVLSL